MIMLAVLVLTISGSVAGFYWADQKLKAKALSVSELLADRDVQNDKIDKLQTSKNSIQDKQALNDLIDSLLPKQKKQDNLVANIIYTATTQAGIHANQITNISFNSSGAPDSLSGTTLSKDVHGIYIYPFNLQLKDLSYATMIQLFTAFERNQRIIQADQVQITPDQTSPGNISSLSLSLKTFVQP